MHKGEEIPRVSQDASVSQAIVEMTAKRLGMTAVMDSARKVAGIFTDGDLRRALDAELDPHGTKVMDVMTVGGQTITPDALAMEAMQKMQAHSIQGLLVISDEGDLVGALNFQDLLKAGVV
jgi:arabinose-5-phosphate isomerase